MKKYTSRIGIATIIGVLAMAIPAMAATTASLSPASVNVTTGKSFSVTVAVNPQGASNYAERLEIDYPASNLEVTSFTLGSNWMALTQPGYDSTDNANGILIKTGGYPGGISGVTTFGTVTFYAKKAGSGSIKIGNQSLAFEANSQSAISGSGTVVTVSAKAITPVKTVEQVTPAIETTPVVEEATNTTPVAVQAVQNNQTAAVAESGSANYTWLWIVLIIIVLALIGWWMYSRKSEPRT